MSGYGGIIAMGLAGGLSGAASAGVSDIEMQQKEDILARREKLLSQLRMQEHATNKQTDADIDLATLPKKGIIETQTAVDRAKAMTPVEVERADALRPGRLEEKKSEKQIERESDEQKNLDMADPAQLKATRARKQAEEAPGLAEGRALDNALKRINVDYAKVEARIPFADRKELDFVSGQIKDNSALALQVNKDMTLTDEEKAAKIAELAKDSRAKIERANQILDLARSPEEVEKRKALRPTEPEKTFPPAPPQAVSYLKSNSASEKIRDAFAQKYGPDALNEAMSSFDSNAGRRVTGTIRGQ